MKVTLPHLHELKLAGTPIVMVTAYDHPSGRLVDQAGVDMVLVGDSAANTVLGHDAVSTVGATMDELLILTRAVARGCEHALVIGDLPFMSYQVSDEDAVRNGGRFIKEAGADAVKLEGGGQSVQRAAALTASGIPVMGHLGLTPQSVLAMGGYKVQARTADAASALLEDAAAIAEAGVFSIVLEGIPSALASRVTAAVPVPTIGIGAGPGCDGQVLVVHDLLGMLPGTVPKFVRQYANVHAISTEAIRCWAADVRAKTFPSDDESYG
jgi:3-methyl-2-oxobutanoate hydroxymethyltransferase